MDLLPRLGLSKTRSRSPSRGAGKSQSPLPSPPSSAVHPEVDSLSPPPSSVLVEPASPRSSTGVRASLSGTFWPKSAVATIPETPASRSGINSDSLQIVEYSFPSLLSPPNPAFVAGNEARGILMNARRISRDRSDSAGAPGDSSVATSPFKGISSISGLTASRPLLRSTTSEDSVTGKLVSQRLESPPGNAEDTGYAQNSVSSSRKIRFAPLPDPRQPRRYSTGRDVWVESEQHLHLTGPDSHPEDWASTPGSSLAPNSLSLSVPQSTSLASISLPNSPQLAELEPSVGSSYGSASTSSSVPRKGHRKSTSMSNSISKLFKLGRSKDKDMKRTPSMESTISAASLNAWLSGEGEPLSRRISTGALNGQLRVEQERMQQFRPTGIPMRRSNTSESAKERKRPVYPSVAQGGLRKQNIQRLREPTPEPEFREWSHPSAVGEDEDDGSGLAWLKKRRQEREAKEKAEEERLQAEEVVAAGTADPGLGGPQASQKLPMVPETELDSGNPVKEYVAESLSLKGADESSQAFENSAKAESEDEDDDDLEDADAASDDEAGNEEDDEPLSAAELEEEERLQEEARRTTEGAANEKYHDHAHREKVQRPPVTTSGSSASLELARRGSPSMSELPRRIPAGAA